MTARDPSARARRAIAFLENGFEPVTGACAIADCLGDRNSVVGEDLRLLAATLENLCEARRLTCLAITSALPGEGKSTAAVGLAAALAREAGRRVLLVEADLRRPSLSGSLGLGAAPGLGEWLEGGLEHVPVRRVTSADFFVLAAGQLPLERPEVLKSPLMEALLAAARRDFDFVVLDAPPVLPVADTVLMQNLIDAFVLITRSRVTPRAAILEALGRLQQEKVLGVVLNDHREYAHSYNSYAHGQYKAYDASSIRDRSRSQ